MCRMAARRSLSALGLSVYVGEANAADRMIFGALHDLAACGALWNPLSVEPGFHGPRLCIEKRGSFLDTDFANESRQIHAGFHYSAKC